MGSRESGRPKYSAEVHQRIVEFLRGGAFKTHAANACNVSYECLRQWLQWGADGREPYVQFAIDCERAIAEDAIRNQLIITKAARGEHAGDWKAAAWCLEKKFPKLYGAMGTGHDTLVTHEKPFSPWKQPAVPTVS